MVVLLAVVRVLFWKTFTIFKPILYLILKQNILLGLVPTSGLTFCDNTILRVQLND